MFRTMIVFFTVLFFSTTAMALPTIGQPAPAFKGMDTLSGKEISLSDFKGKTVVLEWHNPECPFIRKYYSSGAMQALQANAAKDGVVWISINSAGGPDKEGYIADAVSAQALLASVHSNTAHYLFDRDGSIGHSYGAKTTPHMFVIDKAGNVVYMGAIDSKPTADAADITTATPYVADALASLKNGTPVIITSTRPYGCGVKY